MSSYQPIIHMQDVVKTYSTAAGEFTALKSINLQVNAGEFVGIVGKSGAGKSTLLNMLTGVDHLTSGEVIVDTNGTPVSIHKMTEDAIANWRAHNLGVMFQSFQLLPMLTLVENVMLPMDLCGRFNAKSSRERALERSGWWRSRTMPINSHRRSPVASSSVFRSRVPWPIHLKLVQTRKEIQVFASADGLNWGEPRVSHTATFDASSRVGLFVCSGNTFATTTADFDPVRVNKL